MKTRIVILLLTLIVSIAIIKNADGQGLETINIGGVVMTAHNHTDTDHPGGFYTFAELSTLQPPAGFDWVEPNDLATVAQKGGLSLLDLAGYVYPNRTLFTGRIGIYAVKARNEFYKCFIRSSGQFTFSHRYEPNESRKFQVRWVQSGTHASIFKFGGTPENMSINLQIYLGLMPDPEIITSTTMAPLMQGLNLNYLFDESYTNYRTMQFVKDTGHEIELILDEDKTAYYSKTSMGQTAYIDFLDVTKSYTIVVGDMNIYADDLETELQVPAWFLALQPNVPQQYRHNGNTDEITNIFPSSLLKYVRDPSANTYYFPAGNLYDFTKLIKGRIYIVSRL